MSPGLTAISGRVGQVAGINTSRDVLSEAVDGCICFTRKIQHGGDQERSRPKGPKNAHNFLITVRPLS